MKSFCQYNKHATNNAASNKTDNPDRLTQTSPSTGAQNSVSPLLGIIWEAGILHKLWVHTYSYDLAERGALAILALTTTARHNIAYVAYSN